MTPAELGGIVGGALAVIGVTATLAIKISGIIRSRQAERSCPLTAASVAEQTAILREIRDAMVGMRAELTVHRDKLVAVAQSQDALHRRFDDVARPRSA